MHTVSGAADESAAATSWEDSMKVIYSVAFGVATFFALNCGSGEDGYPAPGGSSAAAQSGAQTGESPSTGTGTGASASASDPTVVEVKVNGHDFAPAEIKIKANQTVRWVWVTGTHNVISGSACTPDGAFSSGTTDATPNTFEHKFEKAGSFPYFCDPHCGVGMKGKITVE